MRQQMERQQQQKQQQQHEWSVRRRARHSLALALALWLLLGQSGAHSKPLNQNQVKFRRLPPREFSAALGSSITIECEAGSSPPPSIHWLKNGVRIPQADLDENQLEDGQALPPQPDETNRIALSSTRSRLFIDCADYASEAEYSCVAENAYSRVVATTQLALIKPAPAVAAVVAVAENELEEPQLAEDKQELSALAQCPPRRDPEPARIHMWTHNIVEVMRNSVVLLCRSNLKRPKGAPPAPSQQSALAGVLEPLVAPQAAPTGATEPKLTWTLPDERQVTPALVNKFEVLETGDLLVKDLRWSDMGSYVCTVSDDTTSDSVSAFVYPASVKAASSKRQVAAAAATTRLAHFR